MPISEAFTGSAVTIGATETSLTTNTSGPDAETSDGWFQAFIDTNAIAAADIYQFKVYEKVLSSSTQRACYSAILSSAQTPAVWISPTLGLLNGWDMTLKKIAGADEVFAWSIRKAA